jgi:hypothetical protein
MRGEVGGVEDGRGACAVGQMKAAAPIRRIRR